MTSQEIVAAAMAMPYQELISKAHEQGCNVGQISLAEFLLKSHTEHMGLEVKIFLQKVLDDAYKQVGLRTDRPAEDVALTVGQILENTVK